MTSHSSLNEVPQPDAQAKLLKRWVDVLHLWQEKCEKYEQERVNAHDTARVLELEQGIQICQGVIQTSKGLIQALNDTQLNHTLQPPRQGLSTDSYPPVTASLTQRYGASSTIPEQTTTAAHSIVNVPAPSVLSPQLKQQDESVPLSLKNKLSPMVRRLGWVLGIAAVCFVTVTVFRLPLQQRDACKIAPGGSYHDNGLSLWVKKALKEHSLEDLYLSSVYVGQFGCTIVLKGTVPNKASEAKAIRIARNVLVPDQSGFEGLKRNTSLGDTNFIKPVKKIISQLRIENSNSDKE